LTSPTQWAITNTSARGWRATQTKGYDATTHGLGYKTTTHNDGRAGKTLSQAKKEEGVSGTSLLGIERGFCVTLHTLGGDVLFCEETAAETIQSIVDFCMEE
jgi:hypothetical protein